MFFFKASTPSDPILKIYFLFIPKLQTLSKCFSVETKCKLESFEIECLIPSSNEPLWFPLRKDEQLVY